MSALHSDIHGDSSPPSAEALRLGYEPPTIGLRPILLGIPIFIAIGVVVFVASWYIEKTILMLDAGKAPALSSVQPAPITSAIPLPPLQPSANHPTVDRQDLDAMHAAEDRVFADLGWQHEPAPVEDAEKTRAITPFHVPDSVIAAVAKRTPANSPMMRITKATPEPAPVAPEAGSNPSATVPPVTPSAAPTTGGAQ